MKTFEDLAFLALESLILNDTAFKNILKVTMPLFDKESCTTYIISLFYYFFFPLA